MPCALIEKIEMDLRTARRARQAELKRALVASGDVAQDPTTGHVYLWGWTCPPPFCVRCCERHWRTKELTCMVLARREKREGSSGNSFEPAAPGKVLSGFPNVLEFLSMTSWPDGAPRIVGTLTITSEAGSWKCTVKDRDSLGVAFVTAETPDALLKALEAGLGTGKLEWRDDKFQGGNGKRRA
jgi:hypothetical protein